MAMLTSYLSSSIGLFIVAPIFIELFGNYVMKTENNKYALESQTIFYLSFAIGQISYSLLSQLNSGYIFMPLAECLSISSSIVANSVKKFGSIDHAIPCLAISTVLSSGISMLIYSFKLGNLISMIPSIVTDALLVSTALFNFKLAFDFTYNKEKRIRSVVLFLNSILFLGIGLFIMKAKNDAKFIVILLVLIVLNYNLLAFVMPGFRSGSNSLFLHDKKPALSILTIYNLFKSMRFNLQFIISNFSSILNLSIFPIISFATTLPHFSRIFNISCDFNSEMKPLGLVNLICTSSLFPVTMNCTGSIFFRLMGACDSRSSLIGGFGLLILYFIFHRIVRFIPTVSVSFLAMFIGSSILLSYINQVQESSLMDSIFLFVISVMSVCTSNNILIIIPFSLFISYAKIYFMTGQTSLCSPDLLISASNKTVTFIASKSLDFTNVKTIFSCNIDKFMEVVFDLKQCKFIDYTANLQLINITRYILSNQKIVKIVGSPKNLSKALQCYTSKN